MTELVDALPLEPAGRTHGRGATAAGIDLPGSLEGFGMIGVDCETYDPDLKARGNGSHRGSYIVGVAIATELRGFKAYLPLRHPGEGNMPVEPTMAWLKRQMALPKQPKVGANLIYDYQFLAEAGVELKGDLYDVQVAEPLLDENRFTYSLEALAKDYLGVGKFDQELDEYLIARFGKKNPKNNIWQAPADVVSSYAIEDARLPIEIFLKQKAKLLEEDLWDLFLMESKLIPMLAAMRKRGVKVNVSAAEKMRDECKVRRDDLVREVFKQTNIAIAPSGMGKEILRVFQQIGVTEFPLTPKLGKPQLTAEFIQTIDHPVAQMIVEVRKMDKLIGTFLEGCILEGHHKGRIHCNFNQLRSDDSGAVSGRFSSTKPNLQFIPVRNELGKRIRSLFLPEDGQAWYKLDFSQIEYVLMIHDAVRGNLPGAADIANRYTSDESADFHQLVADMTGLDRQRAKTINFGLAYGEGVVKLCRQLGLAREDGEALIREYHKKAPFMRPLINAMMNEAGAKGEVKTLMGRKRRFIFWEFYDFKQKKSVLLRRRVAGARRAFTHKALNARIQGSAADVMKLAMVGAWQNLGALGVPQLTVHDELDGSVPKDRAGYDALCELKQIMQECIELTIPLRVDGEVGPDWGQAGKIYGDVTKAANPDGGGGWADMFKSGPLKLTGEDIDFEKFKILGG